MTAQAGDTFSLKHAQRRELRRVRAAVAPALRRRAAVAAARHALNYLSRRHCRRVAVYLSAGSELDTAPLLQALWHRGFRVCVPVMLAEAGRMRFAAIDAATPLRRKRFGIREPLSTRRVVSRRQLDAILLPLVGFDDAGHRLGAGGGYYDRWLARQRHFPRPLRVGYAYAVQRVALLPHDPWDVRLDAVVTEQGTQEWPTG
jgi:5-formyltetrahydrofolate cyclo-ligase